MANVKSCGAAVLFALALGSGCESHHNHEDFMPPETRAREALEKALTAWKEGKGPTEIAEEDHDVQPYDERWRAGDKLEDFKILSVEPEAGKFWFTVNLKMKSPRKEVTVKYVVIGIDPLQVFRQEDYAKLSGS